MNMFAQKADNRPNASHYWLREQKEPNAYIEFKGELVPATDWFESGIDVKPYVDKNGIPL